jgi:ribosomal protein L37E
MDAMRLEGRLGTSVIIDVCPACQAFWFDQYESLHLSPGSTLKLFSLINGRRSAGRPPAVQPSACPRCGNRLVLTHDLQNATPFQYFRCEAGHGRFIGFFDFLKEKDFIRPLTGQQLADLRANVRTTTCANCGAAVDLVKESACSHCGSPLSMLDVGRMQELVATLADQSRPKPIDPSLPLLLAQQKVEVDRLFAEAGERPSTSLIDAGLNFLVGLIRQS